MSKKNLFILGVLFSFATTLWAGSISFQGFSLILIQEAVYPENYDKFTEFSAVSELLVKIYPRIYNTKVDGIDPEKFNQFLKESFKWHEKCCEFLYDSLQDELVGKNSPKLFKYLENMMRERFSFRSRDGKILSDYQTIAFGALMKRVGERCAFVVNHEADIPTDQKKMLGEVAKAANVWASELSKVEAGYLRKKVRFR